MPDEHTCDKTSVTQAVVEQADREVATGGPLWRCRGPYCSTVLPDACASHAQWWCCDPDKRTTLQASTNPEATDE